jgi:Flp pilus assembly pilin Flp
MRAAVTFRVARVEVSMAVLATISRFGCCRVGASAIEYALIAGLVAVVLAPALFWLRDWQEQFSQKLNAQLDPVAAAAAMIEARNDFREPPRDPRDHLH